MRERGLSTVELMIVLTVIGIMAAFTVPNLPRWSTNIRMGSSVKEIASELQLARMKAIAQNTSVTLCFYDPNADFPNYPNGFFSSHVDANGWCPEPPATSSKDFERFKLTLSGLPVGIKVTPKPGSSFTFNSRGQVNAGYIDLNNLQSQTAKRITVHFTGRVKIDAL
jgi:Tfp pilus assembly protein FimT